MTTNDIKGQDFILQKEDTLKSEEVQTIIDRMPTCWAKWVALCVGVLIGIIVLLGFLIQYPDTVDGQISVTASSAPVRLVANSNGRMILLRKNKAQLQTGDVIGFIENGANYKHILLLDSLLQKENDMNVRPMPDSLLLGDVSPSYNAFLIVYLQYERLLTSNTYAMIRKSLQHQIQSDEAVIANLSDEAKLKERQIQASEDQLKKDSLLLAAKGVSEQDYQQKLNAHLSLIESNLNLKSSLFIKRSEITQNQLEIRRVQLEENEMREKVFSDMVSKKNELANSISLWKERYLLYTPVTGELEFLGFWRNNCFVQAGEELFSIIPDKNSVLGEVIIPSFGAGKVKAGQKVNVKMSNYPYDEYGLLKGVVKSVSRMVNKRKISEKEIDTYLVNVYFPDGMVTNFGKELPLDFESKGTAEIITKRKRLIERLFDNLKAKKEK